MLSIVETIGFSMYIAALLCVVAGLCCFAFATEHRFFARDGVIFCGIALVCLAIGLYLYH